MSVIVCHACDLAHRFDRPQGPARVRCVRCRAELYRTNATGIDTVIALALTALVLFIIGNAYPLVAFKVNGLTRMTTLAGAALGLYDQGYATLAVLVTFTAILVPLTQILAFLYVLVPVRVGLSVPGREALFRMLIALRPWAMSEVFVLGAIVALVKLSGEAEVSPRIALIAYGLFMFTLTTLTSVTPTEQFWRWIRRGER
ncbi:MAG TPA: paraquat-inducible protein A [Steroidobacteraceae bacterium]|nr:paraquat-inducible protein A [Steroidobacteraceae bacterium]